MEKPPKPTESIEPESIEVKKARALEQIIARSTELSERRESLPFAGIMPESYEILKAESEEFPEYVTAIDEMIARFRAEGMRVVLGKDSKSGNVTIVPWGSTDPDTDSIMPRHLQIPEMIDVGLKELILRTVEYRELAKEQKQKS